MKKAQLLSLFLVSFLLFSSCKDFMEVEPQFMFPASIALSSLDGLDKTTTGAFNAIQSGNIYGGGLIANSEFLADFIDSDPISDFSLNQFRTRDLNSFNGQAGGLWSEAYRAINICNIVLENLPNFEGEDPDLSSLLFAECHFIRGVCHFELVRMFAQPAGFTTGNTHLGIPIRTYSGGAESGVDIPRSSVAKVYEQVIKDLKVAFEMLDEGKPTARASKWAAAAFLGKAYFQLKDYHNAEIWTSEVINSDEFSLSPDLAEPFNLTGDQWGDEMIFQVINVDDDISNGDLFRWNGNDKSQYKIRETITDVFDLQETLGDNRIGQLYINFFDLFWTNGKYANTSMNVPVIRLSEMFLTRAESRVLLSGDPELIREDVNIVRVRAGLVPDSLTTDLNDLLGMVRYERRMELAFEGDRFHDLKRRQEDFDTPVGELSWADPRLVYPIPQKEVDENPNMIQNDGY